MRYVTEGKWYHNTDAELSPGDEIVPANERGHHSRWSDMPGYDSNIVYFTDSRYYDPGAGSLHGKNRYEVEPIGGISRDPDFEHSKASYLEELEPDDIYNDKDVPGYGTFAAPRARVIRRIVNAGDLSGAKGLVAEK